MDKGVAVAVAAVVGGLVVTQAPLNSQLGRAVGGLEASVVALAISFLAILTLLGGDRGHRRASAGSATHRGTSRSAAGSPARSTSAASCGRCARSAPAG